jgi:hypothetical protein
VRRLGLGLLCLLLFSCRDVHPVQVSQPIQGYRLEGTVSSLNGVALSGVNIRLFYNYDYVGSQPVDTQIVQIKSQYDIVDVAVYTPAGALVTQLFLSTHAPGPLARFWWDGKDRYGADVPSGEYFIRYTVGGAVVKNSAVVVDGRISAVTDSAGHFTLGPVLLPVGVIFDGYLSDRTYEGTFAVNTMIDLLIQKASLRKLYSQISLQQNSITTIALSLE